VNHRYFNLSTKLPAELGALEGELRERLRKDFDRGHISVGARWVELPERADAGVRLDLGGARAAAARLRDLQVALGLSGEVTLELVAQQPEVFVTEQGDQSEVDWAAVEPVVAQAAAECRAMRGREGEVLAAELRRRLELMEQAASAIETRIPARLSRERDRLRASVAELLDGRPIDETRLAQELAFLADKLDITEELVRFAAHVAAARQALAADKPIGKQLGFLAQELGREVNTIGSKANDPEIAHHVIAMKGELEKFREQLENLE
jgi:uncharacterized protein (TIGR00255 family)